MVKLDWILLKGSLLVSGGMLVARGLAFLFYLVLADAFDPRTYGEIQYAIVVAEIFAIGTQPFGQHVLARFIGLYKDSLDDLQRFFSNAWIIFISLFVVTLLIAIPALFFLSLPTVGILIVVAGMTIFYAYWGLARGFLASGRLVIAYLGSNMLQLILALWLIKALEIQSVLLVLVIYGGTYLLPLLLLQIFRPLRFPFDSCLVSWSSVKSILQFFSPIWLSHATYMLSLTLDILLLKQFSDSETLGRYSLAKTIGALFIFVPTGISTILMPRIASLRKQDHRKLLVQAVALSLLINLGILAVFLMFGEMAIQQLFGAEYLSSPLTFLILSAGMIILGVHGIASSVLVGKGRAEWETISRFAILGISALVGWRLIPSYGGLGAALSILMGGGCGLIIYGVLFVFKRREV
jgi:O-antigen/teichoic acid export membrane protein